MSTINANLPQTSIDWLQDLIQVNIDSWDGFREAAENVKDDNAGLASLFRDLSNDRAAQASELQAMVSANSVAPEKSGSISAAAHRTWMDLRKAMGGGPKCMLEEAERGEDYIKGKYEEAIDELARCRCADTLRRHFAAVKASHDAIKALRDQTPR